MKNLIAAVFAATLLNTANAAENAMTAARTMAGPSAPEKMSVPDPVATAVKIGKQATPKVAAGYIDEDNTGPVDRIDIDAKDAAKLTAKFAKAGIIVQVQSETHSNGIGGAYTEHYLVFEKKVRYVRYVSKDYADADISVPEKDLDKFVKKLETSGKGIVVQTDVFPSSDEEMLTAWEVWYVDLGNGKTIDKAAAASLSKGTDSRFTYSYYVFCIENLAVGAQCCCDRAKGIYKNGMCLDPEAGSRGH